MKQNKDAAKHRIILKAAEALVAACEINGLPINALLPHVKHLATKLIKIPKRKSK